MLESLKQPLCRAIHIARRIPSLTLRAWRFYRQNGLRALYHRVKSLVRGLIRGQTPINLPINWGLTPPAEADKRDYGAWVRLYDSWPVERLAAFQAEVAALPVQPRFLVRLVGADARTAASLDAQAYPHWRLETTASTEDPDWVLVVYPGTVLAPHALLWMVSEINRHPQAQLIYGDEDFILPSGERVCPDFKPEWNPLLFYSTGWLSSLYAVRRRQERFASAEAAAGSTSDTAHLSGLLQVLGAVNPAHIHRVARVLSHRPVAPHAVPAASAPTPTAEGARLLESHLKRRGVAAELSVEEGAYRLHYPLPQPRPLVSILIPTRNGLELMRQCVESLCSRTTYSDYEIIIIDNGSDDPDALAYFAELAERPNVRVLRDERPFNYSALNNLAAAQAQGEVLVLMNNDIEVISPGWLDEMVSHVMQPEVGAVGAKLLYPNDTLQHAGVMLGIRSVAGHVHKFLKRDERGYQGRAAVAQNLSAVTAACLAVRKQVWQEVGGLNETDLTVAFNDVDFCIRLVQAGYRNVWTPYAELYHHESVSRGTEDSPEKQARFAGEVHYMRTQWADVLLVDPAYNPALTLDDEDYGLAWPPRYA